MRHDPRRPVGPDQEAATKPATIKYMKTKGVIALLLFLAAIYLGFPDTSRGQARPVVDYLHGGRGTSPSPDRNAGVAPVGRVCADSASDPNVRDALRLVCLRKGSANDAAVLGKTIVIGFVGGFVASDNVKHPEVQFAAFLRHTEPSTVHAEVFANHDGAKALRRVLQLLDGNGDGVLTDSEKQRARIIIYGHSWGASQAVTLARELEQINVPVLLTIQVDSVRKPGQDDSTIPANVEKAVNFYQTRGLIHGRSEIRAADAEETKILGNFRMTYRDRRIDCDNYPWIARHLNRPHHEIENDPEVWGRIASLIDEELSLSPPTVASSPEVPLSSQNQ